MARGGRPAGRGARPRGARPRVLSTSAPSGSFDYDPIGNLTHREYGGEDHDFVYDGHNRLREVILPDGSGEVYYYDHAGQRILAYSEASSTQLAKLRQWFGATEIEYDATTGPGTETRTQVFAALGAMPVARISKDSSGSTTELLYSGVLGSLLTVLSTQDGSPLAQFGYGPFGELLYKQGGSADDFRRLFNGKEQDQLTSLAYYGFRYYDKLTLTWTQTDPLFHALPDLGRDRPRRTNLYVYSLNNPLTYVDPQGLCSDCDMEPIVVVGNPNGPGQPESPPLTPMDLETAPEAEAEPEPDVDCGGAIGCFLSGAGDTAYAALQAIRNPDQIYDALTNPVATAKRVGAAAWDDLTTAAGAAMKGDIGALTRLGGQWWSGGKLAGIVAGRGAKLLGPKTWSTANFAPGKLDGHFSKHAAEWGAGNITKTGYLKRARSLLGSSPGGDILGKTRANGDILRYNRRTNEFAAGTSDGTIKTLFRPDPTMHGYKTNLDYYNAQ